MKTVHVNSQIDYSFVDNLVNSTAYEFIANAPFDCYYYEHKGISHNSYDFLLNKMKKFLISLDSSPKIEGLSEKDWMLKSEPLLILIGSKEKFKIDPWTVKPFKIDIQVHGRPDLVQKVKEYLCENFPSINTPVVEWHYQTKRDSDMIVIDIPPQRKIYTEFYPNLKPDVFEYIDSFWKSDAALLVLRGTPGTGKTSFIQNIIWRFNASSMITYDTSMLENDKLFIDFISNESVELLILEDADNLLISREKSENKVMNKFLNLSDGLIRFPRKKMIISANTVDDTLIDTAMIRSGRCFDAPIFDKLTFEQSKIAARVCGIKEPTIERNYSLAELFGNDKGESRVSEPRKIGF